MNWKDYQIDYEDIQLILDALCNNTVAETFVKVMMEMRTLVTPSKEAQKALAELGIEKLN